MKTKTPEQFQFLAATWDIDKAKDMTSDREPMEFPTTNVENWANMAGIIYIDKEWAMENADLDKPLIFTTIVDKEGNKSSMLIDGWHRLWRAFQEGKALKAVLLNAAEDAKCRV